MTVRGSAASAKGERILAGNDLAPAAARVRVAQKIVETFVRTLARRPGDRIGRLRQRLVEALVEGSHAETLSRGSRDCSTSRETSWDSNRRRPRGEPLNRTGVRRPASTRRKMERELHPSTSLTSRVVIRRPSMSRISS